MSKAVIPAAQLQVAALSCICLASKQHERHPITGKDLDIFINICTAKDLRIAEQNTLFTLQWDANCCTPLTFMDLLLTLVSDNNIITMLRKTAEDYFDIAISDYSLIGYSSSMIGIACLMNSCLQHSFDIKPLLDGLMNADIHIEVNENLNATIMDGHRAQSLKAGPVSLPFPAVSTTASTATANARQSMVTTPASTITSYSSPRSLDTNTPSSLVSSTDNSQDGFDIYPVSSTVRTTTVSSSTNFSSITNPTMNRTTTRYGSSTKPSMVHHRTSTHPTHILSPIRDDMMDTETSLQSHYSSHKPMGQDFGNRSTDLSTTVQDPWLGTTAVVNHSLNNMTAVSTRYPAHSSNNTSLSSINMPQNIFSDDEFMNNDLFTSQTNHSSYSKGEFYCNDNNYRFDMIDDIHAFSVSVTAELLGNAEDDDTLDVSHGTDSIFPDDSSASRMDISIVTDKNNGTNYPKNLHHPDGIPITNKDKNYYSESQKNKNYFASIGNFPTSVTSFQKEYSYRN